MDKYKINIYIPDPRNWTNTLTLSGENERKFADTLTELERIQYRAISNGFNKIVERNNPSGALKKDLQLVIEKAMQLDEQRRLMAKLEGLKNLEADLKIWMENGTSGIDHHKKW